MKFHAFFIFDASNNAICEIDCEYLFFVDSDKMAEIRNYLPNSDDFFNFVTTHKILEKYIDCVGCHREGDENSYLYAVIDLETLALDYSYFFE